MLVDFWAEWCGPCKKLAPVIDQVAEEFDGQVVVAKVNVKRLKVIPMNQQRASKITRTDPRAKRQTGRIKPDIESNRANRTALSRRLRQDRSLIRVQAKRFFAVNMLTLIQAEPDQAAMRRPWPARALFPWPRA